MYGGMCSEMYGEIDVCTVKCMVLWMHSELYRETDVQWNVWWDRCTVECMVI